MDITTTSDNAESPDAAAAAPTKPSLRSVDQALTNLTTREEDLDHGPLLLGFGDGFGDGQEHVQDPHPSHLGLELAPGESARYSAYESILPLLPSGVPLSLSARAMTLSTISQSGASLSLPSGTVANETVHHPEEETTIPGNQNAALPLAWHYEFSWKNSRLCFDTTPLEIVEVLKDQSSEANPASEPRFSASQASFSRLPAPEPDPFSTAGIGVFCGSAEVRPTLSIPEDFEVSSINSSDFCYGSEFDEIMVDDYIPKSSGPGVSIAMENKAQWLAELLFDDFIRSYAPQQSRKQTAATKHQDLSSEPSNKAQRFAGDRGHVKKSRYSKAAGRSEGSGDETSGDDGQGPSPAAKSSDSKYLACPFLKWDAIEYATTCSLKFKHIRNVKKHIRDRHQRDYCPDCEMIYEETGIQAHTQLGMYRLITSSRLCARRPCFFGPASLRFAIASSLPTTISIHKHWTSSQCCSKKSPQTPPPTSITSRAFWASRPTWKRASVNTTRCLVGCTVGDFTAMWVLQAYYPELSMAIVMPISMASGISSSILLETVMLRIGRDGLSWLTAARTAIGMSFISMLTMEAAENAVDYYLTGGQVALNDPAFWVAALVSIAAGFMAPLPYNYARLRKYGKACH
ncbi:hypothetical protein KAF25_007960 [Fusarium avenaceum]|uniref:DUF4396 domain-containing protein n=1 Tax=Fusarium avenaceum TaxID=40199 RepID=A0A9P7H3W6_9HYPO|nr:hypothetical protein KAF25_007960 [Fusarium avenaceum]